MLSLELKLAGDVEIAKPPRIEGQSMIHDRRLEHGLSVAPHGGVGILRRRLGRRRHKRGSGNHLRRSREGIHGNAHYWSRNCDDDNKEKHDPFGQSVAINGTYRLGAAGDRTHRQRCGLRIP